MKMRIIALFAGLLAVLPMTSAWAGSTTTYYYGALKAAVSSTGGGKVYAATSNSAPSSDKYVTTNVQSAQNKSESQSMTFYAFAQVNDGYEFGGWATSDGGTVASTDNPYAVSVTASSTTDGSPTVQTVYALFTKKQLAAFGITFETGAGGTYTVDGQAPADKTGLTEATTVKLASTDPNFLNWKVNGAIVNGNPYDLTCTAATTVGAEFLTADQVAEATTFDALTAALANDGKRKITIPAGVDIVIAKGASVTVPAGKQLVLNGSLAVVGTLANSGAISGKGTIYKISYLIEQGEINKPLQVTGEEWGNMAMAYHGYKPYYRVTATTANAPKIALETISGCTESWAVLFKGKAVKISKQSPKALAVTRDTADSASTIKSIADNANTDEISGSGDYVLLQDCTISGPLDKNGRVSSQKAYDCAGHKATISASKIAGSNMLFMNGVVALTPSSENQNSIATFINCSSMTINKIKNGSPKYYFYDCGSAGAMASLSFAFYNNKSDTTNYRQAYFYSGYYAYTFNAAADATDGGGHSYVYNGSFSSDPSAYLQQGASPNGLKVEGSKSPYKVVENVAAVNCVQVGDAQYASLVEAVSAISSSGTLSLILPVTLKEKLVIPSGKKITIDLNGLNLSGGSIENSGALRFEDNSGAAQPGTLSTPVVGKAGTIDITFGAYAGSFRMEGGVLTTHNGTFASTFSATEAGGRVSLRGGLFLCEITVPDDYRMRSNYLGQKVIGHIADASQIGSADVSYLVNGFNPNDDLNLGASDKTLYLNFMQSKSGWASRRDFVGREALWDRLAELRSVGEPIKGQAFEASISFDRAVDSETVSGWAKIRGTSREMAMDQGLNPDEDYHILIPLVTGAGYTAKSFKHMFDGEDGGVWEQVHCGVENKSLDNIGTTVTVKFQIRMGGQKAGYVFETERSRSYKFTGKGAIAEGTDYTTLAAAIGAVAEGGTVRLSKDCAEAVSVARACRFALDANGFAFTGSVKPADGYEMKVSGGQFVFSQKKAEEQTEEQDAPAEPEAIIDNPTVVEAENLEGTVAIAVDKQVVAALTNGGKSEDEVKAMVADAVKAVPEEKKTVEFAVVEAGGTVKPVAESAVGLANLKTGAYTQIKRSTVEIGGKVTEAVETTDEVKSVVMNESKEQTVVLAIPGKTTVADAVKTTPTAGDQIQVYDAAEGAYRSWVFKDGNWTPVRETLSLGREQAIVNTTEAKDEVLPAGSVIRYRKNDPAKAVAVVTDFTEDISSTPLEVPEKTDGSDPKWNLMANPTGKDFDLGKILNAEAEQSKTAPKDKVVIVSETGLGQKTYEKGEQGWGYWGTETYVKPSGKKGARSVWIGSDKDAPVLKGGQSMWYISNGGKPKIEWNKNK